MKNDNDVIIGRIGGVAASLATAETDRDPRNPNVQPAKRAECLHPLARFGYSNPPHWLWRRSPRAFVIVAAIKDIWLIVTGRCSLHRAWQAGRDDGSRDEMLRQMRGGR